MLFRVTSISDLYLPSTIFFHNRSYYNIWYFDGNGNDVYHRNSWCGNPTWRAGISTIFQYGEFSHWTIDFGDVPAFLPGTTATSSNMRPGGTNQGASAKKPSSRHSIKCGKHQHLECADNCPKVHSGFSTSMIGAVHWDLCDWSQPRGILFAVLGPPWAIQGNPRLTKDTKTWKEQQKKHHEIY